MDQFDERGVMGHHLIRGHILAPDPNRIADSTPVQHASDALVEELEVVSFRVIGTDMDRMHACSGEGDGCGSTLRYRSWIRDSLRIWKRVLEEPAGR